jgi:predicted methyltransferase MtxX (methanogen marker protein 4)
MRCLRSSFGLDRIMRTAILEDGRGKCFLLTPVGIDEGLTIDARLELAEKSLAYFSRVGWKLRIGVLFKGRTEDIGRGEEIRRSLEEGELLTKMLRDRGHVASHNQILIEDAIRDSDLIVAPDGVTGNLIFRSVHFVGGGNAYGAPVVNLEKVFVDTSRAKADFSDAVLVAAGLAVSGSKRRPRA